MSRDKAISHEFVDFIPKSMEVDTLYVSMEFATASHLCFCGCGAEVVTPFSPVQWQLSFDGEAVSLSPSIGSWALPCESHYWIKRDKVVWSGAMSKEKIAAVRRRDIMDAQRHYDKVVVETPPEPVHLEPISVAPVEQKAGFWASIRAFFR